MLPKGKDAFLVLMRNLREHCGFLEGGPPVTRCNEEGRLHSEVEPAFRSMTRVTWYRDGRRHGMDADFYGSVTYYWRNVMIPPRFFMNQKDLTLDEVLQHPNVEVRCVGLEIYGYQRMADEGRMKVIHQNRQKEMVLYEYVSDKIHTAIRLVRLKNSTPEPDGTYKIYFLCVPPDMTTCEQAVAWTFGKTADEYVPSLET